MHCCVKYNVVSFFIEYFHVLTISYSCVGKPVLPIGMGIAVLEQMQGEWVAMFVVVFISSTADFQKLLHNVSSLVRKKDNSVIEISRFTYCSYIFHLASCAKV